MVARAAGTSGAVAVTSGTAALHLALHALGVSQDDLVVLPSLAFIASANAISYCGASPWLLDVQPESWTLDPEQLAKTLHRQVVPSPDGPVERRSGRRLAALLPVHTLGHPADIRPIREVAATFDLPVVADAAAALGASYRGCPVGAEGATVSAFSFNGNKTVTAGGGGALVSHDFGLLQRARHLSTTARRGPNYQHDEVGFNYRLTNLQAAVGCAQMEQLDEFIATKRRVQATYTERFRDLPGARPFPETSWAQSACWLAGFLLEDRHPDQVESVRMQLRSQEVDARPFWKPMHLQRPYKHAPRDRLTATEHIWPRVLTLPSSTNISPDELDTVASAVWNALAT
jgi:dTDP-4-amino-4,6-dideoxygalactose transaminase